MYTSRKPNYPDFYERQKKAKETALAITSIDSYLKAVMPASGYKYIIQNEMNGVVLKVKIDHGRAIVVKLTRSTYLNILKKLLPALDDIRDSFAKIGRGNIKVVNDNHRTDWFDPNNTPK